MRPKSAHGQVFQDSVLHPARTLNRQSALVDTTRGRGIKRVGKKGRLVSEERLSNRIFPLADQTVKKTSTLVKVAPVEPAGEKPEEVIYGRGLEHDSGASGRALGGISRSEGLGDGAFPDRDEVELSGISHLRARPA